jgi:His/Glu/Gln/Arg/opine family amino acid ABC transporter permease subunit
VIDFPLIWHSLPSLLHGTILSLEIALISTAIGLIFGSSLALAETSSFRLIRYLVMTYVTLLRGTPMLVQILFVYYVLPQIGLTMQPFYAASLAIGLNSAAYISQTIGSGIRAVSKGQIEAAYTLGFTPLKAMIYIVFPQAFRFALPSLGNELITLIKDSSLASIIGVMELTKEASVIRSRTYDAFSILLVVSVIYLILTATLSIFIKKYAKS